MMYPYTMKELCREMDSFEEKFRSGGGMTESDLRRAELVSHTMKNIASYCHIMESSQSQEMMQPDMRSMQNLPINMGVNSGRMRSYADGPMSGTMNNGMSNGMSNNMGSMNNMNNMSNMGNMSNNSYGYPMGYYPEERRW